METCPSADAVAGAVNVNEIPSFLTTVSAPFSLASKTGKPRSLGTIATLIVLKPAAPAGEGAAATADVAPIATAAAAAPIRQASFRWAFERRFNFFSSLLWSDASGRGVAFSRQPAPRALPSVQELAAPDGAENFAVTI